MQPTTFLTKSRGRKSGEIEEDLGLWIWLQQFHLYQTIAKAFIMYRSGSLIEISYLNQPSIRYNENHPYLNHPKIRAIQKGYPLPIRSIYPGTVQNYSNHHRMQLIGYVNLWTVASRPSSHLGLCQNANSDSKNGKWWMWHSIRGAVQTMVTWRFCGSLLRTGTDDVKTERFTALMFTLILMKC